MRIPFSWVLASLLVGCTSTTFLTYQGAQQEWPTSPGALAEEREGVPIYHVLQPKPYDILGELDLRRTHLLAPTTLGKAASEAKKRGEDPVIVLEQGNEFMGYAHSGGGTAQTSGSAVTTYGGGSAYSTGRATTTYSGSGQSRAVYHQTARVVLIRFRK